MQVQPPKPPPFGCNAPCHRRRAWLNNHLLFLLSLSCCIALSFSHTTIDRRGGYAAGNPARLGRQSALCVLVLCLVARLESRARQSVSLPALLNVGESPLRVAAIYLFPNTRQRRRQRV